MGKKQEGNRLVVGDRQWAKDLPEWLLEEVKAERMVSGLASVMTGKPSEVGDAEVAVFLFTASLRAPLSHEYTEIYVYLTTKLMKRKGQEMPEDIRKEELTEYEQTELEELRRTIYRSRGGEIQHPLFSMLKEMKKEAVKQGKKEPGQLHLGV